MTARETAMATETPNLTNTQFAKGLALYLAGLMVLVAPLALL